MKETIFFSTIVVQQHFIARDFVKGGYIILCYFEINKQTYPYLKLSLNIVFSN